MDMIQRPVKYCEIFNLIPGSMEWIDVKKKFMETMKSAHIAKIERIQNRQLWKVFKNEVKYVADKNGGSAQIMLLFHGTSETKPELIYSSEEGFNLNYSKVGLWGKANYFAFNSSYSNNYAHVL